MLQYTSLRINQAAGLRITESRRPEILHTYSEKILTLLPGERRRGVFTKHVQPKRPLAPVD